MPEKIKEKNLMVGLDIGTSKICALVAAFDDDGKSIRVLGLGIAESEGLNRGVVVNIDRTVKAIKSVIAQAEQQAGMKIEEVVVGIAGDHVESFQTSSIVTINSDTQEISQADVDRLLVESRKVNISSERQIIHVIPQDYLIDGQDGITEPVGMSGVRMEANVHVVTGLRTALTNIHRCVERAGLKVKNIVLEPLASSKAVLTEEEKEVGVALIDIGGGTTDIAIFEENIIRYTNVFAIAGKQVTDDVRKGLGIIHKQAERIKREYGYSFEEAINNDEVFMIPGIGGRKPMEISVSYLCRIIQPRMEEIFEFALAEIRKSGFENRLGAGVVITGGTTLLKGTEEIAHKVLGLPVKIGIPTGISYSGLAPEIESPVYATAIGLALFGMDKELMDSIYDEEKENFSLSDKDEPISEDENKKPEGKKDKDIFGRVKNFLKEL